MNIFETIIQDLASNGIKGCVINKTGKIIVPDQEIDYKNIRMVTMDSDNLSNLFFYKVNEIDPSKKEFDEFGLPIMNDLPNEEQNLILDRCIILFNLHKSKTKFVKSIITTKTELSNSFPSTNNLLYRPTLVLYKLKDYLKELDVTSEITSLFDFKCLIIGEVFVIYKVSATGVELLEAGLLDSGKFSSIKSTISLENSIDDTLTAISKNNLEILKAFSLVVKEMIPEEQEEIMN